MFHGAACRDIARACDNPPIGDPDLRRGASGTDVGPAKPRDGDVRAIAPLLLTFVFGALLAAAPAAPRAALHFTEVDVRTTPLRSELIWTTAEAARSLPPQAQMIVSDGLRPIGVASLQPSAGPIAIFELPDAALSRVHGDSRLTGWLVPADLVATLAVDWPGDAPRTATIDSLGPGIATAWLDVGEGFDDAGEAGDMNAGSAPQRATGPSTSDATGAALASATTAATPATYWIRSAGQPACRFDVVFSRRGLAFARVVPLAASLRLGAGQTAAAWPAPGSQRAGRLESAVGYISREAGRPLAWVAAPPTADVPPDPHIDLLRDGRWLGYGSVQRADDRFWYVAVQSSPGGEPRVGDTAKVRTLTEIAQRRFVAHVFDLAPAGALIDAGEADGLAVGQDAVVYRDGSVLTRVEVVQVQRGYAIVQPVGRAAPTTRDAALSSAAAETPAKSTSTAAPPTSPSTAAPPTSTETAPAGSLLALVSPPTGPSLAPAVAAGDEVWFAPPPAAPAIIGVVDAAVDDALVLVELEGDPPLGEPLLIRDRHRTVAAVILVAADASRASGYVVPHSLDGALVAGFEVVRP